MSRVRVKVCGLTRARDVAAAVGFGADAVGFVFWPGSKRAIVPEAAAALVRALPPLVAAVGVFVRATPAHVARVARAVGLGAVQLHGAADEPGWRDFPWPVIRAVPVTSRRSLSPPGARFARAILADAPSEGWGGSGTTFDWSLVAGARPARPLILSGGLNAANVARAIRQVRPFAVDVASGVESAPGIKDHDKLRRFLAAVRGVR